MKVTYDPHQDTVRILFNNAPIDRSVTEVPGVVLDYDDGGRIVGLELSEASQHIHNPRTVDFVDHASPTDRSQPLDS